MPESPATAAIAPPTPSAVTPLPPSAPAMRLAVVAAPVILAALLFLPHLARIPGVNADEAWVLERVRELSRGSRPWNGMTFYVAAMHQYVVWPFVALLGESPFAIRLPGALINLISVGLITATAQRLWGARTGLLAGLLLATAPIAVTTMARFGIEVPALSPFFAAVAFACLSAVPALQKQAAASRRARAWSYVLAYVGSAALGALAYNHVVLLPVPVALALTILIAGRRRVLASPVTLMAALGFLLGCSARIYDLMQPGMWRLWLSEHKPTTWAEDIVPMLSLVLRAWDGSILYQRFAGGSVVSVIPYPALALLGVLALRGRAWRQSRALRPNPWRFSRAEGHAVLGVLLAALITTRVAPHLSIRYAIVLHVAMPVLLAAFARPMLQPAAPRRERRITTALLALVIALNLFYLWANFFAPFLRGGGGLSVFPIGTRLIETSNHFAREDQLYAHLRAHDVKRVDAEMFIVRPLQMYDLDRALSYGGVEPAVNAPGRAVVKTAVIFYNGPQWKGAEPPLPNEDARSFGPIIRRNNIDLAHDPSFPALFRVYIAQPAPAP